MNTAANPLRQPCPPAEETHHRGRYRLVDVDSLELQDFGGVNLHLSSSCLWLNEELAIPLNSIQTTEIVEKWGLPRRIALRIVYTNPITGEEECAALSKMDILGVGVYRREPLKELSASINIARANAQAEQGTGSEAVRDDGLPTAEAQHCCEVCGATPAYYVNHVFLVTALFFLYQPAERRRMHCASHIMRQGFPEYLVTMLLGWPGIGIVRYPIVLYQTALNLKPVFGDGYWVLFCGPLLTIASLIIWFFFF